MGTAWMSILLAMGMATFASFVAVTDRDADQKESASVRVRAPQSSED